MNYTGLVEYIFIVYLLGLAYYILRWSFLICRDAMAVIVEHRKETALRKNLEARLPSDEGETS